MPRYLVKAKAAAFQYVDAKSAKLAIQLAAENPDQWEVDQEESPDEDDVTSVEVDDDDE